MMRVAAAGLGLAATGQADPRPLKVFILAGQSNMEGHARIETFDYHYLGCAKTFALMGRAFAEATLQMMKEQPGR
jgi:hypothetical protein